MRNSSEALMRKEEKVSRYLVCVSYTFLQMHYLWAWSQGEMLGVTWVSQKLWCFPAFCRKRLLVSLFIFKSAQRTNKTYPVSCRSESRHVSRALVVEKEKNGCETSLWGHTDPAVSGSLLRPPFLIDCSAQQEAKDSPGAKEMGAALSSSNKCH